MTLKFYKTSSDNPTHVDLTPVHLFCVVLRHRELRTLLSSLHNIDIHFLLLIVTLKYINMYAVSLRSRRSFPEAGEGNETTSKCEK